MTKWVKKKKKDRRKTSFTPDVTDKSWEFDFERFEEGKIKVRSLYHDLRRTDKLFGQAFKKVIQNPEESSARKTLTERYKLLKELIEEITDTTEEVYWETQKPNFSRHGIDDDNLTHDEMVEKFGLKANSY
jgi:hypothetical protein